MEQKHWTIEDENYLIDNYNSIPIDEMSLRLQRTAYSIRAKAKALGLTFIKNNPYSKEDDKFILDNHKYMTIQYIADHLGRTRTAVNKRIFFLRKRKVKSFNRIYSVIEDDIPLDASVSEMLHTTLNALKIGQSFVFDKKNYTQLRAETAHLKPKIFETKSIDDKQSRVWRIF